MSKPRSTKRPIDGVLLIDKPLHASSNQTLQTARWLLNAAKAGHTGTLDPLATGLLPVCLGEATKFSSYLLEADKRYQATVQFGLNTSTGDAEGEILQTRPIRFSLLQLQHALAQFRGPIRQVPPMHSALKHQGKPLYEYARAGITLERPTREVTIHALELIDFTGNSAVLDICCSKGTYIRTLAEDIGEYLACGAHLSALRRTETGGFQIHQAYTLEALGAMDMQARESVLQPVDHLLSHLPAAILPECEAKHFILGQAVRFSEKYERMTRLRVYNQPKYNFLGLAEVRDTGFLHPHRLIAQKPNKPLS